MKQIFILFSNQNKKTHNDLVLWRTPTSFPATNSAPHSLHALLLLLAFERSSKWAVADLSMLAVEHLRIATPVEAAYCRNAHIAADSSSAAADFWNCAAALFDDAPFRWLWSNKTTTTTTLDGPAAVDGEVAHPKKIDDAKEKGVGNRTLMKKAENP